MTATSTTSDTETDKDTPKKPEPGTGHLGQTFLVGDNVYLRRIDKGDEEYSTSIRQSLFPHSTARTEEWITEDMLKDERTGYYAIVRKADDRIVGSIKAGGHGVHLHVDARFDPIFGERGQYWKGEALALLVPWQVEEQHRPSLHIELPASETIVIEEITAIGMRQTARFREMFLIDGERVDRLAFEYLNPLWVKTLGDPNDVELERTGTGEPRPVPPKVAFEGEPPTNAILIGERVYLRPEEKADGDVYAKAARHETETFFDIGRYLPSSVGQAKWIESMQKPEWPTWIWFSVCLRETDELIGSVGLIDVDYQHRTAETGSFFHSTKFRGSGLGSEAKQLLLEYTFEILGLHMVQSWVYFPNTRSAAALRKQGYREAGRVNWHYTHNGTLDNFVAFDLLAAEWRAMPRKAWEAPAAPVALASPA